jgi:hypothetical protein
MLSARVRIQRSADTVATLGSPDEFEALGYRVELFERAG